MKQFLPKIFRISHPVRYWLLLAVLYTAGSLLMLGSFFEPVSTPQFKVSVPADPARQLRVTVKLNSPKQAVFSIPFNLADMDRTEKYRFTILPGRALPRCTVQVISEGDHHLSFSHVYSGILMSQDGFSFTAPMSGDDAYWKTLGGCSAPWTALERSGLRRLEVKIFFSAPVAGSELELRFQANPSPVSVSKLVWLRPPAGSISLGERAEFAFNLEGWSGNPFDYGKSPLEFEITDPDGKQQRILPFLYQDFEAVSRLDGEHIYPNSPKYFLARYRPVFSLL